MRYTLCRTQLVIIKRMKLKQGGHQSLVHAYSPLFPVKFSLFDRPPLAFLHRLSILYINRRPPPPVDIYIPIQKAHTLISTDQVLGTLLSLFVFWLKYEMHMYVCM